MKAAKVDLLADFLHFGTSDFPCKNARLKSASESSFFRSGVEIHPVLERTISDAVARSSIVFCKSASEGIAVGMAESRLRRSVAAFVILLSFEAGSRKSSWSG